MRKQKVLFICVHNSARKPNGGCTFERDVCELFEAQSAGLEPGTINPLVERRFANIGIDISKMLRSAFSTFGNRARCSNS